MNRTTILPLFAVLSIAAAAPQASAGDDDRDGAPVPMSTMARVDVRALLAPAPTERDGAPTPYSSLSRSEVIADLEVWQHSGLAAAERGDATDAFGARYLAALARYRAMRDSPAFADQVERIARQRGETLLIAVR